MLKFKDINHTRSSSFKINQFPGRSSPAFTSISSSSKTSSQKSPLSEKQHNSNVRMKPTKKTEICENCVKYMQNEAKLEENIEKVGGLIKGFLVNLQEWRQGRTKKIHDFNLEVLRGVDLAGAVESMKRLNEVCKLVNEVKNVLLALVEEIHVLARSQDLVSKSLETNEAQPTGLLSLVAKTKLAVYELKSQLIQQNKPPVPVDDVSKCLYSQLMHEKRENNSLKSLISNPNSM